MRQSLLLLLLLAGSYTAAKTKAPYPVDFKETDRTIVLLHYPYDAAGNWIHCTYSTNDGIV